VQHAILVVEDDDSMRSLIELHLSNAGYSVVGAEDALVAGRRVLRQPPDLMVVDVDLPFMSGLEFVATLQADSTVPCFPVVFITAHEGFAPRAEALGADFIKKPFLKERLLESVARNLRRDP
jgi:DNA-binding response OmpR family regulator